MRSGKYSHGERVERKVTAGSMATAQSQCTSTFFPASTSAPSMDRVCLRSGESPPPRPHSNLTTSRCSRISVHKRPHLRERQSSPDLVIDQPRQAHSLRVDQSWQPKRAAARRVPRLQQEQARIVVITERGDLSNDILAGRLGVHPRVRGEDG